MIATNERNVNAVLWRLAGWFFAGERIALQVALAIFEPNSYRVYRVHQRINIKFLYQDEIGRICPWELIMRGSKTV